METSSLIRNFERCSRADRYSKAERIKLAGNIRIFEEESGKVLYEDNNAICAVVKTLFARLMFNPAEPRYGVWGLALGTGNPLWGANNQPAATPLGNENNQAQLLSPVLRKVLSSRSFLNSDLSPSSTITNIVDFQTVVNATKDNLINVGIREMGLIGGGTNLASGQNTSLQNQAAEMAELPYWGQNGSTDPNSVVLINYKTIPSLELPPGVNIIFSWVLTF